MASNVNTTFQIYSASSDPYKQRINLVYLEDYSSTTALKPRGNQGFIRTLNGVVQRQNYFNEDFAAEHFGIVSGSLATMDTQGQLGEVVDHVIERRDLGQTQVRDYGFSPFTDPDQLYDNPQVVLEGNIAFPNDLQRAGVTSFIHDGIIEPLEIRRVLDRTLPGYPTVAHSVKSSMSISDEERRESTLKTDVVDLRDGATRPFLDQQGQIGDVDIPAQLSDAGSNLAPYTDTDQLELFYPADVLDAEMRSTLIDGFVSGSVTYTAARTKSLDPNFVVARHGFVFSQNDNYGYDSIAFGGLKK